MKKILFLLTLVSITFASNSYAATDDPYIVKFVNVSSKPGTVSPMAVKIVPSEGSIITCTGKCSGDFNLNDSFSLTFSGGMYGGPPEGTVTFRYSEPDSACINGKIEAIINYNISGDPGAQLTVFEPQNLPNVLVGTEFHCQD